MRLLVIPLMVLYGVVAMDTTWWRHTIIYEVFIWSFKDSNGDGIGDIKDFDRVMYEGGNLNKMKIFFLIFALHCALAMDRSWWKHTIMYEIFVWSFKDSDGDGIGDINGIRMMLDHFKDLQIECLYLSPIYKSPMEDSGYDITNFLEVDSRFGTMEDFEELMRELNRRGMKLVVDFVINHSSDTHQWFNKSINKVPPYDEFYIWKNAKDYNPDGSPNPPNNWVSVFGGSAWEWNTKRKQFYLHQFTKTQPDLNLRNKNVMDEIQKIMEFWLKKGIAGMRLDATRHYIEDEKLRDEPLIDTTKTSSDRWKDYNHTYTADLWESYEIIHQLREALDQHSQKEDDFERIFVTEAYTTMNYTMMYYGTKDYHVSHFPFNFDLLLHINNFENARIFNNLMNNWLNNMPKGAVPNWNVENHDNPRVGTRVNPEYTAIMLITIMMAPGVAYIYYGQEIGMTNHKIRKDQTRDLNFDPKAPATRDGERTPMQWDYSINAGFSNNVKPWLPVNTNYPLVNVELQKMQENSYYNLFKTLSKLRKTATLKYGAFKSYVLSPWVLAFTRTLRRHKTYVVVHNLGSETEMIDLHLNIKSLPRLLLVVESSLNSGYERGRRITSNPKFPETIPIRPLSSLVLQSV